jgi:Skp family chaperone for outer membrane proteins
MTKTFRTIATGVAFAGVASLLVAAQAAQQQPKIAYINSNTIVERTPDRTAMMQQFEKEMAPVRARLQAISDSDSVMVAKYTKDEPTLSADAKASRQKEIIDKKNVWRVKADSLRRFADARLGELERPMTELLKKILNDIRQEEGYWFIMDMANANEGGISIVAIDRNMEITDRVLERYKTAAAALPKPAPLGTPPGGPVNNQTGVGRVPPP